MADNLPTYNPQFIDTTVSTLLRTDTESMFKFSTSADTLADSTVIAPPVKPKPTWNFRTRKFKSDTFYVFYKKQFDVNQLSVDNELMIDSLQTDSVTQIALTNTERPQRQELTRGASSNNTLHELPPTLNIQTRNFISNDWILVVLLLTFFTLGWIRYFYGKVYLQSVRAVVSYRDSRRLFIEQNGLVKRISMTLNLVFFINFSLFLELALNYHNPQLNASNRFTMFLLVMAFLGAFIILKSIIYWVLGYLFNASAITKEYVYNSSIYNKLAGIAYLPLILAIPYVNVISQSALINTGFILFLLLYFLQLARGVQIIFKNNSSVFYTILYLCTIEILPMLVLYKLVINML